MHPLLFASYAALDLVELGNALLDTGVTDVGQGLFQVNLFQAQTASGFVAGSNQQVQHAVEDFLLVSRDSSFREVAVDVLVAEDRCGVQRRSPAERRKHG